MTNALNNRNRTSNQFFTSTDSELLDYLEAYFLDNPLRYSTSSMKAVLDWHKYISFDKHVTEVRGIADVDEFGKPKPIIPTDFSARLVQEPINFLVIGSYKELKNDARLSFGRRPYETIAGKIMFEGRPVNGLAWQPRLTEFEQELPDSLELQIYAPLISAGFVNKEEYNTITQEEYTFLHK